MSICGFRGVLLAFALAVVALGSAPTAADAASRARLDDWTRDELVPYLTEQLSRHPRFRGERIAIGALEGGAVAPRIDGLTAQLRTTLSNALVSQQGVHLSWETASGGATAVCPGEGAPGYFLGIEVAEAGGGSASVTVRALDRQERTFVPGFGLAWQGRLSRGEAAALNTRVADESLRGQRALPFDDSQADLVAAHVAGKLSCQLRRRGLDSRLSAPASGTQNETFAQRIETLVSNYLARGQHNGVPGTPALAITARLHPIDGDLVQLWVTATTSGESGALPALATDVYLRTSPALPPNPAILASARVVRSTVDGRCNEARVWRSEEQVRPIMSGWPTDGCVALEVRSERPAYLFALAHAGNGQLQLLYPAACDTRSTLEAVGGLRRFALTALDGVATGASPSFYVVATASRGGALALERHLQKLCSGPADLAQKATALEDWLAKFDSLLKQQASDADWRVVRTGYSGRGEHT